MFNLFFHATTLVVGLLVVFTSITTIGEGLYGVGICFVGGYSIGDSYAWLENFAKKT